MDEDLIRAAEREMRRPAPELHRNKQRRLDDTPGYSFKELGRFDYRAADAIAEGSQGFIVTCQFRREKSATREAMEALQVSLREVAPSAPNVAFSIVKLPCRGVLLLQWQAAGHNASDGCGGERPGLPSPADVVAHLIRQISSGDRARLKHVQRISPIHTTCGATEAHIRAAVLIMAAQHTAAMLTSSATTAAQPQLQSGEATAQVHGSVIGHEEKVEAGSEARQNSTGRDKDESAAPTLRFAIAYRSRTTEPAAAGGTLSNAATAGTPSNSTAAGTPSDGAAADHMWQKPTSAAAEISTAVPSGNASLERQNGHSSGVPESNGAALTSGKRDREDEDERLLAGSENGSEEQKEIGAEKGNEGFLSRERGIAVAAAGFAEGTAQGGAMAAVDLKNPEWVVNVDVMPVGGRAICALGLVNADCVTLRPKLVMKQIGSS